MPIQSRRFLPRFFSTGLLAVSLLAPSLRAQAQAASASADADADAHRPDPAAMADLRATMAKLRDKDPEKIPEQTALAFKFLRAHLDGDLGTMPLVYMSGSIILPDDDQLLREQRRLYVKKEIAKHLAADDLPAAAWAPVAFLDFNLVADDLRDATGDDLAAGLKDLHEKIAQTARRVPQQPQLAKMEMQYYELLKKQDPAAANAHLREIADSANADVAAVAKSELSGQQFGQVGQAFEMAFTAVDGRKVDVAKLRGKVVLVDFWATWCGPCVAELPFVKAAYDKYHDKGFEVIGVSLDYAGDRQKLVSFCQKQALPWPQCFDGKAFKGEFPMKYGILSIPHTFLLDQGGRVVTGDTSGEKLELAVKGLLKL